MQRQHNFQVRNKEVCLFKKNESSTGYNGKCWEGHQKERSSVGNMIHMGKNTQLYEDEIEKEDQ